MKPVDLPNQPALYQDRYKILNKLYDLLVKTKQKNSDNGPRALNPVIKNKLEMLAVKLEGHVAKNTKSSQSYRFNMSILLRDLVKHKGNLQNIRLFGKPLIAGSKDKVKNTEDGIPDDKILITTKAKAMESLKMILLSMEQLKKNKYIVEDDSLETNKGALNSDSKELRSAYATCTRCGMKFVRAQVMIPTVCKYHTSKKQYKREHKEYEYPCCGETTSSTSDRRLGCKTCDHHVYKDDSWERLSKISKFLNTNDIPDGDPNVLALDCEMGFTSLGYEMIRLTVVDFFTCETIFDQIVKPYGQIIDLNSEFSGVHEINDKNSVSFDEVMKRVLTKEMINKNSILIGHGLENDLNVLRLFHSKIIDTAVMFLRGHYKRSLKDLSFEILSRKIQTGEHDSSEDAIATMDIVKRKLGISIDQKTWD